MCPDENTTAAQDNTAAAESEQTTTETAKTTATTTDNAADATKTVAEEKGNATEKATEKGAETATDKAVGAPESYADFKMPEGVNLLPESAEAVKEFAKANNMTQEAAQGMVDMYAQKVMPALAKAQEAAWQKQVDGWKTEATKAHGKEGIEAANKALGRFSTPEFTKFLADTGLTQHPELVGMFRKVNDSIKESDFVDGPKKTSNDAKPWDKAYTSMDK